jgi:DNA-directed RNA polymerase subunit RPC12/RpoP
VTAPAVCSAPALPLPHLATRRCPRCRARRLLGARPVGLPRRSPSRTLPRPRVRL